MGYAGGFVAVLPTDYLQDQNLNLFNVSGVQYAINAVNGKYTIIPERSKWFGKVPNYIGPLLFLTLFTTSAMVTALIVLGYPFYLLWVEKKTLDVIKVVSYTADATKEGLAFAGNKALAVGGEAVGYLAGVGKAAVVGAAALAKQAAIDGGSWLYDAGVEVASAAVGSLVPNAGL